MQQTSAPFGLALGAALSELDVVREAPPQIAFVNPPRPHPRFDTYVVRATPTLGIVWVKALTPEIMNDDYGVAVRTVFAEIAGQLAARYGKGELNDDLLPGSIWDEPRDWASGVHKNERQLSRTWERPAENLPADLRSVYLGVSGMDTGISVVLEYESVNMDAARAEEQAALSDLL